MSDFEKGFAVGWLTSGNDGGSGGDGDGCWSMFLGILAVIGVLVGVIAILFVVSFFLVLKDMGYMWYIGIPFIFGVWDLYVPWELTAGQKLWMFPVTIFVYCLFLHVLSEHIEPCLRTSHAPQRFKRLKNFIKITLHIILTPLAMLVIVGAFLLGLRTVYYLFVVIF